MVSALLVGSLSASLAILAAVTILAMGPGRTINRTLAALLLFEALGEITAATRDLFSGPDAVGFAGVFWSAGIGSLACYLLLLRALDTPLVAPLRARAAPWLIGVASLALLALVLRENRAPLFQDDTRGVLTFLDLSNGLVPVFGFLAAVSALRRAPSGTVKRAQARAFMLAFGARDILLFLYGTASFAGGPGGLAPWGLLFGIALPFYVPLVYVPLLAYGVLQAHLFDIDLKLKLTLRRSTVAGAFVAVFFVASEGAQQLFTAQVGPWLGLVACGILVFAIHPLQRVAERFSDAAMPGVSNSPDYLAFRKLEVYKAAVESALESGGISPKERETLRRLQAKLGIRPEDARAVESDAGVPA